MDIPGLIEITGDAQLGGTAAQAGIGGLAALLHHVAQIAGELQLAGAVHDAGLHLQQLAAHLRPCKAVDHADLVIFGQCLIGIGGRSQQVCQVLWCNGNHLYIRFHQPHGALAAQLAQLALQRADAGFAGVVGDDGAEGIVPQLQLVGAEAVLLALAGQQMVTGDVELLLVGVAAQLDDLHTVQQRTGDGGGGVGGGDEHDAAQIHGDFDEMIPEGAVLGAVQHLQQRGGRVAPHIAGQLVDLVQHQQRVHRAGAGQGLDDAAGHRADVRFAVAADVGLVADAAQGQAGALAVHGPGHG